MSFILCRYFERSAQVFKIPLYNVLDVGASNGEWAKLVKEHYPDVKFQLDMLYHDIKNGKLESGLWMKSIEEVKEKYPKPTTPPPH